MSHIRGESKSSQLFKIKKQDVSLLSDKKGSFRQRNKENNQGGKNLVVRVNYAWKRSEEEEVLLGHVGRSGGFSSLMAEKEN